MLFERNEFTFFRFSFSFKHSSPSSSSSFLLLLLLGLLHTTPHHNKQNHRRYVKSFDKTQLLGGSEVTATTTKNCEPLTKVGDQDLNPCGLIANSLFNGERRKRKE
jgi:hypothetical protein